jgi:hypothetical protein
MIERPVQVQPVSPELLPDFLAFFDGEAFADNPKWGFCYCQFSYFDHAKTQAQNHYGPLSMFLAAGFVEHSRDDEGYITLRLELRQPQPQPPGGSAR